jgi:hypothetical protein
MLWAILKINFNAKVKHKPVSELSRLVFLSLVTRNT